MWQEVHNEVKTKGSSRNIHKAEVHEFECKSYQYQLKILKSGPNAQSQLRCVTTVRWYLSKVVDWETTLMSCMAIPSPLMKPKLGSETRLHQNYITVKSSLKSQATADAHCILAVWWGKSRGDQGIKKPSGNNSHTPLIVVPNLGVDVVGERPSTKDPNGGIGEKERLWIKLPTVKTD